ncbi:MAG: 2TM domain-containing protein [Flavobacterium sp.]
MEIKQDFNQDSYERAQKRVQKIKGFYTHLLIYIVINAFLLSVKIFNDFDNTNLSDWQNYNTLFFWGIGLFFHGISVFGFGNFLTKDWEDKKIKEIMEKEKAKNQTWN